MLWAESPSEREWSSMRGFSKHYLSCAAHMTKRTFYNAEWTVLLNMTWNLQGNYTHLGSSSPFVRSNTEPRYNERPRDWQNTFAITRLRYMEVLFHLTIIPRALTGSESIAHEAEGWMGYSLIGHEVERNNCFSKIQLVGQKYRDKTTLASKTGFSCHCFGFQSRRFSLLVGYNI